MDLEEDIDEDDYLRKEVSCKTMPYPSPGEYGKSKHFY